MSDQEEDEREIKDVTMGTTIGASGENIDFPRYKMQMTPAKPFLMPSFDDEVIEILPSEKANRKIRFDEDILVQEIENRFAYAYPEDDDDDSYEIEIVEDDGDADFYLEIVDGEVFYVFETEDDISDDESEEYEDDMEESDEEADARPQIQLPIASLSAPDLDADDNNNANEVKPKPAAPKIDLSSLISDDDDMGGDHIEGPEVTTNASPEKDLELKSPASGRAQQSEAAVAARQKAAAAAVTAAAPAAPAPAGIDLQAPCSPPQSGYDGDIVCTPPMHDDAVLTTPPSRRKPSVVDQVPEPVSPIAQRIAPATPTSGRTTPTGSILKACPDSPKNPASPKKKKKKSKEKKEKTYTKTYVRPEAFDGEHCVNRVYSWEKPDWTKKQLRKTRRGEMLEKDGNLANPITFPKGKKVNEGLEDEEEVEHEVNKEELIRRIMNGDLPGYRGRNRKLKFSLVGENIRSGKDLAKPITRATMDKQGSDINKVADPTKLRSTNIGSKVREGKNLAAPVTQATVIRDREDINHVANKNVLKNKGVMPVEKKKYSWSKPEWAVKKAPKEEESGGVEEAAAKPALLKHTAAPVEKKKYEWEKPSWAAARPLKSTGKGKGLQQGDDLAQPITQLPDLAKSKENQ